MTVRAKFKVTRIETSMSSAAKRNPDGSFFKDEQGRAVYVQQEMRTLVLHPVYSQEEGTENKTFWDATPSGELRLGTINPSAWKAFELDKEYYIDFSPAA